ncbi:MAG: N-acetylneuraminate synthase [Lachnospiraceae bacterium]|nr:N-acetylneuraminate synthase [Lachnospiraceae bacterium]
MSIRIIAEAGVNHNGSMELAKQMVDKAKEAGADYIKFQTFQPEKLVSKYAQKAEYQKKATGNEESQLEMLQKLALTQSDFRELKNYCEQVGIGFLSTPFDLDSIDFLESLDMDFWKIPSGEITNLPYLIKIAQTGRPIVMSTGMCQMEEIEEALMWLKKSGAGEMTLLHCNTQYPTPMEDVNLHAMQSLRRQFGFPVGYSDHTEGIEVPIGAAAMGATVLEKHFTLDKTMEGPDQAASLAPEELAAMVRAVRNIERALGSGEKGVTASEMANRAVARKSIVAAGTIRKGETFGEENLTVKRPGAGISPMHWFELLGKTAQRDYSEDELIAEEELLAAYN